MNSSFGGITWDKKTAKTFHANTCLYYSKGAADYVGMWNFNEFFLPRGRNRNLPDVLQKLEFRDPNGLSRNHSISFKGPHDEEINLHRGMADNGLHPFCSLTLHTETTLDTFNSNYDRPVRTAQPSKRRILQLMTHTLAHSHTHVAILLLNLLFMYSLTYSLAN